MSRHVAWHRGILYLATATLLPAFAQTPPDAGQILRELKTPPAAPPMQSPAPIKLESQDAHGAPESDVRFVLRSLRIKSSAFSDDAFRAIVQEYVGKEIGLAELNHVTQRVTQIYREHGYLVARAYLPEQEIRDGAVEVAVLEGTLGERQVTGNVALATQVVDNLTRALLPGTPLREYALERSALLLADVPGVANASAIVKPGARTGGSDVEFELAAARKFSGAIELDNFGNRFTGRERLSGQMQYASPNGWGDLFGLRLVTSGEELISGRLSYQAPALPHGWRIGGAVGYTEYELGDTFAELEATGRARVGSVYALYPFVRSQRHSLYGQVQAEYKSLEDDILGVGTDKDSRALSLVLAGDYRDRLLGGAATSYTLSISAGELDIDTAAARDLDEATARTRGGFNKMGLSFIRLQRLTDSFALYAGLSAQLARENLDSSEKFALGGVNGVRAYPQSEAIGDRGHLGTVELRYRVGGQFFGGNLEFAAFYDQGRVTVNARPWRVDQENKRSLSGAGMGLTFAVRDSFFARLNVAGKTGHEDAVSDKDKRVRAWLQLVKRF